MLKLRICLFLYAIITCIRVAESVVGEVTIDRVETAVYDPTCVELLEARTTKFNRTTYVINGRVVFLKPIDTTWNVYYELNKYQGNEYHVLASSKLNYCKALEQFKSLYDQLLDSSNFPREPFCPIPPNDYYIKEFGLEMDYSILKTNKLWKLYIKMLKEDAEMFGYAIFFEVSLF